MHAWSQLVAFGEVPAGSPRDALPSVVEVMSMTTGATRVVGRTHYSEGVTDWAVGTGHYVAWTDERTVATDDQPAVAWDLHVSDLTTGHDTVIASSNGAPELLVPLPQAGDGYVVWTQFSRPDSAVQDLHLYDTQTGRDRVVASAADLGGFGEANHCVVYSQGTFADSAVRELPVVGGAPVTVLSGRSFQWLTVRNGHVTWQQPGSDRPTSLWAMDVPPACGPSTPSKFEDGQSAGNAIAGVDFAAFWNLNDDVQIAALRALPFATPASPQHGAGFIPARIDATDNEFVWAERSDDGDGPISIAVAQVVLNATMSAPPKTAIG